jgi:hypothetical protein
MPIKPRPNPKKQIIVLENITTAALKSIPGSFLFMNLKKPVYVAKNAIRLKNAMYKNSK